jgi:hypothetical protein
MRAHSHLLVGSVLLILTGSSMQSGATPARISRAVELVRPNDGQRGH